jgi:hypothetical protein
MHSPSCRSINVGIRCTSATDMPRCFSPHAASSPSRRCPAMISRGLDHCLDIGDIAEGAHIGKSQGPELGVPAASIRSPEAICRKEQWLHRRAPLASEPGQSQWRGCGDRVNAVLLVPAERLNADFGKRPLVRQHRGQKYAVVARVRLVADHGNVAAVGNPRNELLDRSQFPPFRCRRPPLTRALWQGTTSCAGSTTT